MNESDFTYAEVGGTLQESLPPGYRHLHYRTRLGRDDVYERAAEAILTFRMHRGTGARVKPTADRAAPGVRLTLGLGPLTVPCEIVYVLHDARRAGFGYGTLPGHQARGEEAFLVERDPDGSVWFSTTSFSVPARLPMRLLGPLARVAQHGYARLCGQALRRACRSSRTVGS
ncbi:DUF1990 family protein [Actinoplanes sp. TFC3]|uniref:DUF1990 family protein n=1 Tax=Actinoplanes sp. TFC3 TaxID=1710355 RepID=UPI000830EEF8|nr:DUF1990 domain-containing protein [Actinoplanes sp. TFC3]